jgi:hypothetical protein
LQVYNSTRTINKSDADEPNGADIFSQSNYGADIFYQSNYDTVITSQSNYATKPDYAAHVSTP